MCRGCAHKYRLGTLIIIPSKPHIIIDFYAVDVDDCNSQEVTRWPGRIVFLSSVSLTDFIADLRSAVFQSQSQAARHFGLHHTTVGRYENDAITAPVGYLVSLAQLVLERLAVEDLAREKLSQKLLAEVNTAIDMCYPNVPLLRTWDDVKYIADEYQSHQSNQDNNQPPSQAKLALKMDWGTAPYHHPFLWQNR